MNYESIIPEGRDELFHGDQVLFVADDIGYRPIPLLLPERDIPDAHHSGHVRPRTLSPCFRGFFCAHDLWMPTSLRSATQGRLTAVDAHPQAEPAV